MTFIPRDVLEGRAIGQWVRLTKDIDVLAGRFTEGTFMKITGFGLRGLDLEDIEGNKLTELSGLCYEKVSNPYLSHISSASD